MSTPSDTDDRVPPHPAGGTLTTPRSRAATQRARPLRSDVRRILHRRLVLVLLVLSALGVGAGLVAQFGTHHTDLARAQATAAADAERANVEQQRWHQECLADPSIPADEKGSACGDDYTATTADFLRDPRLHADVGLPMAAIGVGVGGTLVAALVGATAVGADWSSRAMITLLTWEPRRLRMLARRFTAVAVVVALLGMLGQAVALGLTALTVQLRGSWTASGADPRFPHGEGLIGNQHFWRDLLSLELRTIGLMVLAGLLAAALATVTRHTGGMLGVAFAWFAVIENVVRAAFYSRGWSRWLVTENIAAYLLPGGQSMPVGERTLPSGEVAQRTVLVSNLDALLYLGAITAALMLLAGLLLRRRDL